MLEVEGKGQEGGTRGDGMGRGGGGEVLSGDVDRPCLAAQVAETVVERVADISRFFPEAVDVGCGRGHVAKAISEDLVGSLYQCDMAEHALVSNHTPLSASHPAVAIEAEQGCCTQGSHHSHHCS